MQKIYWSLPTCWNLEREELAILVAMFANIPRSSKNVFERRIRSPFLFRDKLIFSTNHEK